MYHRFPPKPAVSLLLLAALLHANLWAADSPATSQDTSLLTHFQATVYEVQVPTNRLSALDAKTLAGKAATADDLLTALNAVGTARLLYRIDQPANVYSERILMGSNEPVITGVRTTATGATIKSTTTMNVGIIIGLTAQSPASEEPDRKNPTVKLDLQLSALAASSIELAPGVKATTPRTVAIEHRAPLAYGQPQVMLAIDMTKAEEPPAAYVIRYLFTPATDK